MTATMPTPSFPDAIDSTMLMSFACPRRFYWEYVEHLRAPGESIHLLAGGAFSSALQTARLAYYQDAKDFETAKLLGLGQLIKYYGLREPTDSASERSKACHRVVDAYLTYLESYPFDLDQFQVATIHGKPAVEFNFALPAEVHHPVTNQPLILCGTLDWIANKDGMLFVVDEKTGQRIKQGKQGHSPWEMRAQFMQYAYAAKYFGFDVSGVMVREVALQLEDIKIAMSPPIIYCEDWKLTRWWEWANNRMRKMVECYLTGEWELNMGELCEQYDGCQFMRLCTISNPHDWKTVGYKENTWNPLARK
jgi:hypothetical protein